MNIMYIIGVVVAFVVMFLGMLGFPAISFDKLKNFWDVCDPGRKRPARYAEIRGEALENRHEHEDVQPHDVY